MSGRDKAIDAVASEILKLDPDGSRTARVLRSTIDQLYDGQRTGRYRWDQLFKTEKTHCGTLVEINMQREFKFADGDTLDFKIAGHEVDCKYSQKNGSWMIPPEAHEQICLVLWAKDDADPKWSMGLVWASVEMLGAGGNRDAKKTLNRDGRESIRWLFENQPLPPNVLLQLDPSVVEAMMAMKSGAERIRQLFRVAQGKIVGRNVVATVAQQDDYMKRVRANGGARSSLQKEGIIILGQYKNHMRIAENLGLPIPTHGDSISARVVHAKEGTINSALIDGGVWRVANADDGVVAAPKLPN